MADEQQQPIEYEEDDSIVFPLEEAARNIPLLFQRLGVDPNRLYLKTLEEYKRDAHAMHQSQIQLTGEASHLSAHVCNLVMELTIETPHRDVQIDRIFLQLSNDGFQNNARKFRGVYVTFGGTLNAKLTIYKGAKRIDCKGSNDTLTIYASLEKVFALMRERLHNDLQNSLIIKQHSLLNIVASCRFDFGVPLETLIAQYKVDCKRMRNDLRGQTKVSSAQFQGAIWERYIREEKRGGKLVQVRAKLLFQNDLPSVTCAGCNSFEDIRDSFSEFYSIARLALGHERYRAITNTTGRAPPRVQPKAQIYYNNTTQQQVDEEKLLVDAHLDFIKQEQAEESTQRSLQTQEPKEYIANSKATPSNLKKRKQSANDSETETKKRKLSENPASKA